MSESAASSRTVARAIGCSPSTVGRWRRGQALPNPGARQLLEEHCGIPAESWDELASNAPVPAPADESESACPSDTDLEAALRRVLPGILREVLADIRRPPKSTPRPRRLAPPNARDRARADEMARKLGLVRK